MYVGVLNMSKYEMYEEQLAAFRSLDQMRFIRWSALIFLLFYPRTSKADLAVRPHFLGPADLHGGSSRHPPVGFGPGVVKCAIRELGSTSPNGLGEVSLIC